MKKLFSAIALTAAIFTLGLSPLSASSSLVSQFQAQSPVSVFIPANQPVPAQGSTVTFTYDRDDFTGSNADSDYQNALNVASTATVTYVVADLGYVLYQDVGQIANPGDLGYLVLLDFGGGQEFTYAYVGYLSFSSAATSIDASGASGMFSFRDNGVDYLWAPASLDLSGVTAVLDAWNFPTPRSVSTIATSQTLDCAKVDSDFLTACNALSSKLGSTVTFSSGSQPTVGPTEFIGLVGRSSQIQGGLVQSSIVQAPGAPAVQNAPIKYSGPEFSGLSLKPVLNGTSTDLEGRKLDQISSITIDGKAAKLSDATDKSLKLELPAGLAPGVYDLVVTTANHGKLTHMNAIRIREELPPTSLTIKGSGVLSGEEFKKLTAFARTQNPDMNTVTCIVNSNSEGKSFMQARALCDRIASTNLNIKSTQFEVRSTVKSSAVFARVVFSSDE
jgi:hypothetical protein